MSDIAAVVAAAASNRGIGAGGDLVWRLPGDMAHFKRVTSVPPSPSQTNAVIMGRKTWESIPPKFRPLDNRLNVILSRSSYTCENEDVLVCSSLEEAMEKLKKMENTGNVYVIGGGQVYKESLESGLVKKVIYTEVSNLPSVEFDTFFPELTEDEWECKPYPGYECQEEKKTVGDARSDTIVKTDKKTGVTYQFLEFTRKSHKKQKIDKEEAIEEGAHVNPEEMQYLEMSRDIIENGVQRGDRTGTGTLSRFGTQMRFSLRDGTLPLLTTKRTFWRGVAEELLWFVSGNTNANDLAAKDIHIWDGNGSREFLDSRGLGHREVGDLGPVYGFQWRHFGAEYKDMHTDYTGKGVDQLAECIDKIKNNPEDRRIIMSAWNPADLNAMALPPCHMFCQFYVDTNKNELSCQMYQRSADMGLGVPFNIASYALLTHMICQVTGRKPGDFVHTIGDAHVYLNHVDALKQQLDRPPRAFPKIKINPDKKNIDDFEYSDFEVIGYKPHKTIKMKMAV
ncbi:hypothetical protein CTEN210_18293 [Chaetoceros tenuissimus]|uniref:Bifunctional dihydrofolate reductase-thymidylate synthase n=1 Tax=Chaetoceros tenuissimus TaxID=426638 RepID=A0AAD3HFB3_9STRA|nr:hypothetical protein CTEN210_18293 [Chaetoceros tenuissimus]